MRRAAAFALRGSENGKTSTRGVSPALSMGKLLQAEEAPAVTAANIPAAAPDTLLLSWQRDPTSTMQWIGPEAGTDSNGRMADACSTKSKRAKRRG